jgi:hypothetical protein
VRANPQMKASLDELVSVFSLALGSSLFFQ